jgi:hypothetical protein
MARSRNSVTPNGNAWLARAGYLVAVPGVGMIVTPASRWPE